MLYSIVVGFPLVTVVFSEVTIKLPSITIGFLLLAIQFPPIFLLFNFFFKS